MIDLTRTRNTMLAEIGNIIVIQVAAEYGPVKHRVRIALSAASFAARETAEEGDAVRQVKSGRTIISQRRFVDTAGDPNLADVREWLPVHVGD